MDAIAETAQGDGDEKPGRFVHEVALEIDFKTERELSLRFEVARKIYNALLGEALRRIDRVRHELRRHHALRVQRKAEADAQIEAQELNVREHAAAVRKIRKAAFAPYNELRSAYYRDFGCSRFALSAYGTKLSRETPLWASQHAIGATVVQEMVRRAWLTAEKYLLDPRIKPKFMRFGELRSVESMHDADAIRIIDDKVSWSGGKGGTTISMRLRLDRKGRDWVEAHARRSRIVKTRLVRRMIRGEMCYAAQIVLEGASAARPWITTEAGSDIGIDLGLSIVAIDSDAGAGIYSLTTVTPQQRAKLAQQQRQTMRALDRSRRSANPDNFDEKGRIKPRAQRKRWVTTATYRSLRAAYAERSRVLTEQRKSATRTLVNYLVASGNVAAIEKLPYRKWQEQYGRASGFAPGEFVATLERRMDQLNGSVMDFPAHVAKLSQPCIMCGAYEKREFAIAVLERRQVCSRCGFAYNGVQADVVQAWLARFVRVDGTLDLELAKAAWPKAKARLLDVSGHVRSIVDFASDRSHEWREGLRTPKRRTVEMVEDIGRIVDRAMRWGSHEAHQAMLEESARPRR